jgi:hypothetical protein
MVPAAAAACFTWRSVSELQRQTYTGIAFLGLDVPAGYCLVAEASVPVNANYSQPCYQESWDDDEPLQK